MWIGIVQLILYFFTLKRNIKYYYFIIFHKILYLISARVSVFKAVALVQFIYFY